MGPSERMNFCRWPIFSPAWVSWLASFAGSLFCRLASAAASVSPAASKAAYLSPSPSSSSSGLTVLAAGAASDGGWQDVFESAA